MAPGAKALHLGGITRAGTLGKKADAVRIPIGTDDRGARQPERGRAAHAGAAASGTWVATATSTVRASDAAEGVQLAFEFLVLTSGARYAGHDGMRWTRRAYV